MRETPSLPNVRYCIIYVFPISTSFEIEYLILMKWLVEFERGTFCFLPQRLNSLCKSHLFYVHIETWIEGNHNSRSYLCYLCCHFILYKIFSSVWTEHIHQSDTICHEKGSTLTWNGKYKNWILRHLKDLICGEIKNIFSPIP